MDSKCEHAKNCGDCFAADYVGKLEAEIRTLRSEISHLKRHEAAIIEAVSPVCDGGRYVNDTIAAIHRTQREAAQKAATNAARIMREQAAQIAFDGSTHGSRIGTKICGLPLPESQE